MLDGATDCNVKGVHVDVVPVYLLYCVNQGKRPVTLIGYSFGARAIFSCLQEMAKRKSELWLDCFNYSTVIQVIIFNTCS